MGCCRYAWWTSVLMNGLANFFFFPFLSMDFSSFFFFFFEEKVWAEFDEEFGLVWWLNVMWCSFIQGLKCRFLDLRKCGCWISFWKIERFDFCWGFDEKLYLIFKIWADTSWKLKILSFWEFKIVNNKIVLQYW